MPRPKPVEAGSGGVAPRERAGRRGRPRPGQGIHRSELLEAGIFLADTGGLESATTRAVARAAGVAGRTVYHHFHDRDALVEAMADRVLGEALVPAAALAAARARGWRAAVTSVARQTWETLNAHAWVLCGYASARLGPNGLRHAEQLFAALAPGGLTGRERTEAMLLVEEYVLGHVLRSAGASLGASEPHGTGAPYQAWLRRHLSASAHPELVAVLGATRCGLSEAWARTFPEGPDPRRFERGLAVLLDGLEARAPASRP